ncbi:MAG TPA: LPS assembly lipoprotein LptE [Isosphaeraceae bacterium]|nr:LPS assembly lipoprotein LptE [Isosphaeraceae bacterium]
MGIRLDRLRTAIAAILLALATAGCGYHVRPPYNPSVKTVYVPVFKSYRFRQDLNIQLTKMLINEINLRTPYRVVSDPAKADARLEGVITFDDKNVMVEAPTNLPRHIMGNMNVKVKFIDNRLTEEDERRISEANVSESASFYPELGETATTGFQKVMQKIVRDIVNMMEEPWGEEYRIRDEFMDREQALEAAEKSDYDDPTADRIQR